MISIPIGETFESFITWLKDSFSVVFDAISAILNFAIEALENVLLLNHTQFYPALILIALTAFLAHFALRAKSRPVALGGAIAVGVVFLAAEIWRYQQLEYAVTPERAPEMIASLESLSDGLEEASPENYDRGISILSSLREAGGLDTDTDRQLRRAVGELEDLRPNRFDDAEEEFFDLLTDASEGDIRLNTAAMSQLRETGTFYSALSLREDVERLIDDLRELEGRELRRDFLSDRAFTRIQDRLQALSSLDEEWANEEAFESVFVKSSKLLNSFNPGRLSWYPWLVLIILFMLLAWIVSGRGLAIFTGVGFLLIVSMGFWEATMESLALVLSATLFALLIGIPVGISAARNNVVDKVTRPILDFMQTMPAFVYLIPAVLFFGLGKVPGAMATLIFAMPPAVRLTSLGIRQVPTEVVEACLAFGSTPRQLLYKAQLPIARPTILAGLNQTIMLALSMVVIGGMIGAGGLGQEVLSGITQLKIGLGFESGIAVVILAIFLDRVTQSFGGGGSSK